MVAPIDPASLSAPAQRMLGAPEKMQMMAARGIAPGIRPDELLSILVYLSYSQVAELSATALKTLGALPEPVLMGALGTDLQPAALDSVVRNYIGRLDVLERVFTMPRLDPESVEVVAQYGDERATELCAVNEERLLANPRIIECLYMNKRTRMSTADRLIELAVRNGIELTGIPAFREAALAIQNELIMEASEEPSPDDILFSETQRIAAELASADDEDTHLEDELGNEVIQDKYVPLYRRLGEMTVTQKIRAATLGSKEERMLLVRDSNRLVAAAAARSKSMMEPEAVLITRNRSMSEDVLRIIGTSGDFAKNYQIKKNLAENPKTPVMIAIKMVKHLREFDLKALAKSRNIQGPVKEAARRHLERRNS